MHNKLIKDRIHLLALQLVFLCRPVFVGSVASNETVQHALTVTSCCAPQWSVSCQETAPIYFFRPYTCITCNMTMSFSCCCCLLREKQPFHKAKSTWCKGRTGLDRWSLYSGWNLPIFRRGVVAHFPRRCWSRGDYHSDPFTRNKNDYNTKFGIFWLFVFVFCFSFFLFTFYLFIYLFFISSH